MRLSVKSEIFIVVLLLIITVVMLQSTRSFSQEELPVYLHDRGTGIPLSQFGTYIRKGELKIYPFYEYYCDNNIEYKPAELGHRLNVDFRGRYRANEGLIFLGYGISDRLAVEFEMATISARLDKSPNDPSTVPARLKESGLGDVEGQLRMRWNRERVSKPEYFSYFETVFPTGKKNSLIGTSGWELKLGSGLIKGLRWGTVTLRMAVDYSAAEKSIGPGEYAVEYFKRLSDRFRFFFMLEGTEDEIVLVPELQWHFGRCVFLKANNGFGVTSKATDFAPEVGLMFSVY
jgi:hypothetical protein